eukprot:TRINITY_DN67546_c7_g4_i1.p1 TRINITY_DN67546_c7_g4~~TRINITY_DN67546_c7_g4_i1.p1  ORF type:complete len:345 (+),score=83.03 TRINITY_DN67546_c7_g4_i1:40-1074(+)
MPCTKIYGMGNPLLDISCDTSEDFLKKYGLQPSNAILAEEQHQPIYKELSEMEGVQYFPGGSTLNSMRCANWMLRKANPNSVTYVGCIGKDKYGDTLTSKAETEGLSMPVMRVDDTPTGTCAVCIVGKDRSMVANLAAANNFKDSHLAEPAVKKAIEEAGIYYSAGFHLTVSVPAMIAVGKAAAADKNKNFSINLSAPFVCEFFKSQMLEVMPFVDMVFANDDEARAFAKANELDTDDLAKIAAHIIGLPKENKDKPRVVVFTQGAKSTLVATTEGNKEVPVEPIPAEKIIDLNGAGDAFVGGFLAMLALGKDLETCAKCGHYVAGTIIQHSGCAFPENPEQFV